MTTALPVPAYRLPAPRDAWTRVRSGTWLQAFVLFQIACQLGLFLSSAIPFRIFLRTAAFGMSLAFLAFLPARRESHPASRAAVWVLAIVAISFFHPNTNGFVSGLAQFILYLAILAPLFWVPRLLIDSACLRRVLLIIWAFHTISAAVGVLQVYYPGRFQGDVSSVLFTQGKDRLSGLMIRTAGGERIYRPMGLSDVPGGAANSGFYAVLLGLGFLGSAHTRGLLKMPFIVGMTLGMMCLYLCQVRVFLVMLGLCVLALAGILAWRRESSKVLALAGIFLPVILLSFAWAVSIGGAAVTNRLETLIRDRPGKIYYSNRGRFLEHTVQDLLPKYPLGAGLGRWGMVYAYFGEKSDPRRNQIWAEIQWTGWLLDGGVPLIIAYVVTLALAFRMAARITFTRQPGELWIWGAWLLAYNVGALAVTFAYPFFIGQGGMELWALNAMLFTASRSRPKAEWPVPRN